MEFFMTGGGVLDFLLTILVIVVALAAFFSSSFGEMLIDFLEDRRSRNDRGKLKRPSDKYVSR